MHGAAQRRCSCRLPAALRSGLDLLQHIAARAHCGGCAGLLQKQCPRAPTGAVTEPTACSIAGATRANRCFLADAIDAATGAHLGLLREGDPASLKALHCLRMTWGRQALPEQRDIVSMRAVYGPEKAAQTVNMSCTLLLLGLTGQLRQKLQRNNRAVAQSPDLQACAAVTYSWHGRWRPCRRSWSSSRRCRPFKWAAVLQYSRRPACLRQAACSAAAPAAARQAATDVAGRLYISMQVRASSWSPGSRRTLRRRSALLSLRLAGRERPLWCSSSLRMLHAQGRCATHSCFVYFAFAFHNVTARANNEHIWSHNGTYGLCFGLARSC